MYRWFYPFFFNNAYKYSSKIFLNILELLKNYTTRLSLSRRIAWYIIRQYFYQKSHIRKNGGQSYNLISFSNSKIYVDILLAS